MIVIMPSKKETTVKKTPVKATKPVHTPTKPVKKVEEVEEDVEENIEENIEENVEENVEAVEEEVVEEKVAKKAAKKSTPKRKAESEESEKPVKKARNAPKSNPNSLFIGGAVPADVTEEEIKALIPKKYQSSIERVNIMEPKKERGTGKRICFVDLETVEQTEEVVKALKGAELRGKKILIDISLSGGHKKDEFKRYVLVSKKPKLTIQKLTAKMAENGHIIDSYETEEDKIAFKFISVEAGRSALALNGTTVDGIKLEITDGATGNRRAKERK